MINDKYVQQKIKYIEIILPTKLFLNFIKKTKYYNNWKEF
jgi:hypothetical protein